jgi:hypothetical protein
MVPVAVGSSVMSGSQDRHGDQCPFHWDRIPARWEAGTSWSPEPMPRQKPGNLVILRECGVQVNLLEHQKRVIRTPSHGTLLTRGPIVICAIVRAGIRSVSGERGDFFFKPR